MKNYWRDTGKWDGGEAGLGMYGEEEVRRIEEGLR